MPTSYASAATCEQVGTRRDEKLIVLLAILLIGPFLVSVPPLENTVPPRQLADPDSQFAHIGEIDVHYKSQGSGAPVILLLHGFGASTFTWREVMQPLSAHQRAIAYDRPAFGLTERPLQWKGVNPYSGPAQVDLATQLIDRLGVRDVILIGNSAGGRVAIDFALAHPDRVRALVLVSPALDSAGGPRMVLTPILATPQMKHVGPLLVRSIEGSGDDAIRRAWHNPEHVTDAVIAGYRVPLQANDWDRALYEFARAPRGPNPTTRLDKLAGIPTLIITGDDDRIVPTAKSVALAAKIPGASLEVLGLCGHVPQEECPGAFVQVVQHFIDAHVIETEAADANADRSPTP